jgi:HlyD family secretion protein
MKKTFIIAGIIVAVAITALIVFSKLTSKPTSTNIYALVKKGTFELTVTNAGELIAEKSVDVKGPELGQGPNQQGGGQQGGGQGRGNQGFQNQGRGGSDVHAADIRIQDIVPEGTIVKEGDYIAQLDRTNYENSLKDALENLATFQTNLQMKILDTAVVLTNMRDDIKNQEFSVEEAATSLMESKYEPQSTIRQAEIKLDEAKRALEQKKRTYNLTIQQNLSQINTLKIFLSRRTRTVNDLQNFLASFTVKAPSSGMVIYKKERNGAKRKAGSSINAFDMVVATLPDLSSMISKIYVNEIDVSKVKIGQKVSINIDAFPNKAYNGSVIFIANIGEQLPNSDAKLFEVQIKIDGSDPTLRPTMTTGNKIVIKSFDDVTYIPTECVQTGSDSIPFVYEKNKTKQIVVLCESNEKNVIVEQGLEPGTTIYLSPPENSDKFKLVGQNLIPFIRERDKVRRTENEKYVKDI